MFSEIIKNRRERRTVADSLTVISLVHSCTRNSEIIVKQLTYFKSLNGLFRLHENHCIIERYIIRAYLF